MTRAEKGKLWVGIGALGFLILSAFATFLIGFTRQGEQVKKGVAADVRSQENRIEITKVQGEVKGLHDKLEDIKVTQKEQQVLLRKIWLKP